MSKSILNFRYAELLDSVQSYQKYINELKKVEDKEFRFFREKDTVIDNKTGLMWLDTNVVMIQNFLGIYIDYSDPSFNKAQKFIKRINTINFDGYNDWRLPTAKELYSIINFSNQKISSLEDKSSWKVFNTFKNITSNEYWTNTKISNFNGQHENMLKVRFITGMAYNIYTASCYDILPVRGTINYSKVETDEDKEIIMDTHLNLMWCNKYSNYFDDYPEQVYSHEEALQRIEKINKSNYLGYSNWRLPTIEEMLQLLINSNHIKIRESTSFNYLTNTFYLSNLTMKKMSYGVSFRELVELESLIELNNYNCNGYIKLVREMI